MDGMKSYIQKLNSSDKVFSYRRLFYDVVQQGKIDDTKGTDYTPEVNYFYSKAG